MFEEVKTWSIQSHGMCLFQEDLFENFINKAKEVIGDKFITSFKIIHPREWYDSVLIVTEEYDPMGSMLSTTVVYDVFKLTRENFNDPNWNHEKLLSGVYGQELIDFLMAKIESEPK